VTANRLWTEELFATLRALRDEGLPNAEIAVRMGITVGKIQHGIKMGGLTRRHKSAPFWNADRIAELDHRLGQNPPPTYTALAGHFGCSKGAIAGVIFRNELKRRVPAAAAVVIEFPSSGCAWPIGHPKQPGFHFCGATTVRGREGRVWCEIHRAQIYTPVPRKVPA
jgi:GcrA cell cycle regulator